MTQPGKLAILVGGGPAPGINSVIGAATIRARAARASRSLGIRDGFEWIMQGDIDHVTPARHRGRQPHPLPGRLAHRHLARQPDRRPRSTSRTRSSRCCAWTCRQLHHHRRRRHRLLGHEAARRRRAGRLRVVHVPKTIDNDLDLPAARRHLRLPDRAPHRRRDRQEPDGGRQDHLALVLRHRHGPQGRPPGARHRQGGGRHPHPHPGGVRRAAQVRLKTFVDTLVGRHHQAPQRRAARRGGHDRRGPRAQHRSRRTWPRSTRSSATRTATSASTRSTSARSSRSRCASGSSRSASRRPSWPRTSATSCAAPTRSPSTWSTRATSATARPSTCSRAATRS